MLRLRIAFPLFFILAFVTQVYSQDTHAPESIETDIGWPREIQTAESTILVYQPQVEKWENNQILGRAAVSVATKASSRPTFGVIWLTARTEVDKEKHLVNLEDFHVTTVSFPTAPDQKNDYQNILEKNLPLVSWTIALDRLQANVAITQAEMKTTPAETLKNDPPRIIFSSKPAVLVLIDGKPVLRKVEGTNLLRIVNTRALILLDEPSGQYYVKLGERWMQSKSLERSWEIVQNPPASLEKAKQAALAGQQVDETPADSTQNPLTLYVSTTPAELIQTQGDPQFAPIDRTHLLYVKNSSSDLFLDTRTQFYYSLLSGRWFRTQSLNGAWQYVPGKMLPDDFAKISDEHPKGDVLAAIPQTPQAKEAVIENSIPQTASVSRSEAAASIPYDGNPEFKTIESTPLQYVVNSPIPVIRVDQQTYYAVQNGVWFSASSPSGPWIVATAVPTIIYTIPPSSPMHYVTYVKVYGATPEVVYVGYTPGYLGSCVSAENVVVYGTGWYYPPYIGASWIGYPVTYGFHVHHRWNWWGGWGWGFGFAPVYYPWWGPYWGGWHSHHHHPHYVKNVTVNNYYNVNNINVYNRWKKNVVVRSAKSKVPHLQASVPKPHTALPRGNYAKPKNNVFAGQDGQVYRNESKRWEQNQGKKWRPLPSETIPLQPQTNPQRQPQPPRKVPTQLYDRPYRVESPKKLDQEKRARAIGETRWKNFHESVKPQRVKPPSVRNLPRQAEPRSVSRPQRNKSRKN